MLEKGQNEVIESRVRRHYELWPYPHIPLMARVSPEQLWQLNAKWLIAKSAQLPPTPPARIWIAGCGTFQPYLVAQANPGSPILATDWSQRSLRRAQLRGRWHRTKGVTYRRVDLNEPATFPDGPFDFIECYGVLMILKDPVRTLQEFAKRLAPGGIVRMMVYPHYGRQRVFQVQRLARLLGLHSGDPKHPKLLRRFMRDLPADHPLKYAFFSYPDAGNLVGIADGFLHADDQGFTGIDLCRIIDDAGFNLGFPMHRPWGQPAEMAEALNLKDEDPAFWLHYLDLWQSLKGNFILTLTKKTDPPKTPAPFQNPVFNPTAKGQSLRYRARLLRMSLTGAKLQSRTHPTPLKLSAHSVRALLKGKTTAATEALVATPRPLGPPFRHTERNYQPLHRWNLGTEEFSPNPLYSHLFDAYAWTAAGRLPGLSEQIRRWAPSARPLEDDLHPFGLTPYGTYLWDPEKVEAGLKTYRTETRRDFSEVSLENERTELESLHQELKKYPFPTREWTLAQQRELWVLLKSYRQLFLRARWPKFEDF